MKLTKYQIIKIKPGETEYKGYLFQLLNFIDKRSFLTLAADISGYMWDKGLYTDETDLAFSVVHKLSLKQVKSILNEFGILPTHLYYYLRDEWAKYGAGQELEELPTFYDSMKEVKLMGGTILVLYRAGKCILDVVSEKGIKLVISDEDESKMGWYESLYFTNCKISHDKQAILLELLGRMAAHVEYDYQKKEFLLKTEADGYVSSSRPHNYYDISEIEKVFKKREKQKNTPCAYSVLIGSQEWMVANLDTTTFANGDSIKEAKTKKEWDNAASAKQPAWCHYENNPEYGEKFGKLYNWYAVADPRGLAPTGWHIPAVEEWTQLIEFLGDQANTKLQGGDDWFYDNFISAMFFKSTKPARKVRKSKNYNSTGFRAVPGGGRGRFGNAFFAMGDSAYWWTATPCIDTEFEDTPNENPFIQDAESELNIEDEHKEQSADTASNNSKQSDSTGLDPAVLSLIDQLFGADPDDSTQPKRNSEEEVERKNEKAYFVLLYANDDALQIGNITSKKSGFSVRCVRNS